MKDRVIRVRGFRKKIAILLILFILPASLLATLGFSRRVRAYAFCTLNMQPLSNDTRILKESETPDEWIPIVRDSLDRSINRIEEAQGSPFPGVVRVYLCATQQSYNRRTGDAVGGRARGAVFAGRVFLSPRCLEWKSTEGILTHELSHLHFRQHLGTDYVTEIPGWFQEGLAVHVSQGAGAEPVSRRMAIKAITNGNELHPEPNGNVIPRMAADHALKHHMFYRQSAMFVEYLEKESQIQFEEFLSKLFAGNPFGESFEHCFATTPKERWDDFRQTLEQAEEHKRIASRSSATIAVQ